jgi:hypothetical protein
MQRMHAFSPELLRVGLVEGISPPCTNHECFSTRPDPIAAGMAPGKLSACAQVRPCPAHLPGPACPKP